MFFDTHPFQVQVVNFLVLQVRVFQGKQATKSPIVHLGVNIATVEPACVSCICLAKKAR